MMDDDLERARCLLVGHDGVDPVNEMLYMRWYHACDHHIRTYPSAGAFVSAVLDPSRFESGWTVVETGLPGLAGCIEITRENHFRAAAPPFVAPDRADALVFTIGMPVSVYPFAAAVIGGFWHLNSNVWEVEGMPERRRRVYFGLAEGAELGFVRAFADHAEPSVAWSMKCLTGASPAGRRDGAVAFLPIETPLDSGWAAELLTAVTPFVAGDPPSGARSIAPGISQAPDLETERSFGQVLCAALADTGVDPAEPKAWSAAARIAVAAILEQI